MGKVLLCEVWGVGCGVWGKAAETEESCTS